MANENKAKDDLRYIVRVANRDLDGTLPVERALQRIKGVNQRMAKIDAFVFGKETNLPYDTKLGTLNDEQVAKLEDIVLHPLTYGIPKWAINKRNSVDSGQDSHLVMNELDFSLRNDLQRLGEIKSYRGLRHTWGLPVRGQRTKSSFRGKGNVVGVIKKDAKASAAPAKSADKGEKKSDKGEKKK